LHNQAINRLMEGNRRYVTNKSTMDSSEYRRNKIAYKQKPFAAILSCSDSRIPPEIIFDQGLGELFVTRTAGSIVDKAVLASLEFGVYELRVPILVVLGHKRCGAVKFAMEVVDGSRNADSDLAYVVDALKPSIDLFRNTDKDNWDHCTRTHIKKVVEQLKHSPILEKAITTGELAIVWGWYDVDTGIAEITND
jgi:carbonic anhydrase